MSIDFTDQVAIVTGAGQGLGREHALAFASRGAKVLVNDPGKVDGESTAEKVVAEIEAAGGEALVDTNFVGEAKDCQAIVKAAVDKWGRVDVLVNNAGIIRDASILKLTEEDIELVIRIHLLGALHCSQAAFAHMRDQEYGRIITTSSAAGVFGNFGQANYSSAKMGLVGLAKTLAQEGSRKNVLANAIAPGAATQMTAGILENQQELAEKMHPKHVSPLVLYLCSKDCKVSGETFTAVGGHFARVFVAEGPGLTVKDPTPEDVEAGVDEMMKEDGYTIPRGLADEVAIWMDKLG